MFSTRRITTIGGIERDNKSVYWDGTDDAIHFPMKANSWNDSTGDWNTVSCWFKIPTGHTESIQRIWNVSGHNPGLLIVNSGGVYQVGYNTGNSEKLGFTMAYGELRDKWHHIIMTFERNANSNDTALDDSGTGLMKPIFWLNGKNMGEPTYYSATNSNGANLNDGSEFSVGSNQPEGTNNTQDFEGWVADVACYKTKFTDAMAKTVYNDGRWFDHNNWATGANYCTLWARMGDTAGDSVGATSAIEDSSLFGNTVSTTDGDPVITNEIPSSW
tara:strand:- start:1532 stop:2350 length:819 start_codon:yes stop_codon:yes gene_type:complete